MKYKIDSENLEEINTLESKYSKAYQTYSILAANDNKAVSQLVDIVINFQAIKKLFTNQQSKQIFCNKTYLLLLKNYLLISDFYVKFIKDFKSIADTTLEIFEHLQVSLAILDFERDKHFEERLEAFLLRLATSPDLVNSIGKSEFDTIKIQFTLKTSDYKYLQLWLLNQQGNTVDLEKEIEQNRQKSEKLFNDNLEHENLANKLLISHLKWLILSGDYFYKNKNIIKAFEFFRLAFILIKSKISKIDYQNDLDFQRVGDDFFNDFLTLIKENPELSKDILTDDLQKLSAEFNKKAGRTKTKFDNQYHRLMQLFINNNSKCTKHLGEERKSFMTLGQELKAKYAQYRGEHSLLYISDMNYKMMIISEITHNNFYWKIDKTKAGEIFQFKDKSINLESIQNFLSYWLILKKLYLEPSIKSIELIKINEQFSNTALLIGFEDQAKQWLSSFMRAIQLFFVAADTQFKTMEKLVEKTPKNIVNFLAQVNPEIDYLILTAHQIMEYSKQATLLQKKQFKPLEDYENMISSSIILRKKIKLLNETIDSEVQKANNNATALLSAEAQLKAQKKPKKTRKHPVLLEIEPLIASSEESEESQEEPEPLVDPQVKQLENIDLECYSVAKNLQIKVIALKDNLSKRSARRIAFPFAEHEEIILKMGNLFLDYDNLCSLCKKHSQLSQLLDTRQQSEHKDGIEFSQQELPIICKEIYLHINEINVLYSKLYLQKKAARKEFIKKISPQEFIRIGEEKKLKNQSVSEYSKEWRFLKLTEVLFKGLYFLQNKMRTLHSQDCQISQSDSGFFAGREKICPGRYQGMLGFFSLKQYEANSDPSCRDKAINCYQNALNYYKQVNNQSSIDFYTTRIAEIEGQTFEATSANL